MNEQIQRLGWDPFFEAQLTDEEKSHSTIARIVEPARGLSRAVCAAGEIWAEIPDKSGTAVGDWVVGSLRDSGEAEKRMRIDRVLARKNKMSRAAPSGQGYEQILCANVDTAFLVVAVSQNVNLSAIRRYLEILDETTIVPVVVVTKIDEVASADDTLRAIGAVAPGVALVALSVKDRRGLDAIVPYFSAGKTVVLLGASGAGKSTLVNHLLGSETQRVESVRESDQKGRHTTTGRRLPALPRGGMVIDSPGIREIQKWEPPVDATVEKKKVKKATKVSRPRKFYADEDDDE